MNQWPFSPALACLSAPEAPVTRDGRCEPVPGAMVYRLTPGNEPGQAFSDSGGKPYTTDGSGYLQGRGILDAVTNWWRWLCRPGTDSEALCHQCHADGDGLQGTCATASRRPKSGCVDGLSALMLFNLSVSLEWDASYDQNFLELWSIPWTGSSYLYDFTNGQIALGRVQVYQNQRQWDTADIRSWQQSAETLGVIGGIVDSSRMHRTIRN